MVWLVNKKGKRIEFDESNEQEKIDLHINEHGFSYETVTDALHAPNNELLIKNPKGRKTIAVLDQSLGDYAGGTYFAYQITKALAEIFYYHEQIDLVYYAPGKQVAANDFAFYANIKTVPVDDIMAIKDIEADIYFGHTRDGAIKAIEFAQKHNKPCYIIVNDALPRIKEFTPKEYKAEEEYIEPLTKLIHLYKKTVVIPISKYTRDESAKWLKRKIEDMPICSPALNDRVLNVVPDQERKDHIAIVGRIVERKNVDDMLQAFAALPKKWRLQIITSHWFRGDVLNLCAKYGISERVDAHYSVSDYEKYVILKQCKILINSSRFEGFGMWAIEALACGLKVVCYELPTIKEIQKETDCYESFYFAKFNDVKDFTKATREAAQTSSEDDYYPDLTYSFDRLVQSLREALRAVL